MGGNMTHMTYKWPHMPTWPDVPGRAALAQRLALLAIGNALPTMPTSTGWLLAAVGNANNANTTKLASW